MKDNQTALLALLDSAIHGHAPEQDGWDGTDWQTLFLLVQQHKVTGLLLDSVCALPADGQPPQEILVPWQERAMVTMMQQMQYVAQLHQLLGSLAESDVKTVVLKGVALKLLYPQPDMRTMSDADLLIDPKDRAAAEAILAKEGFLLTVADTTEDVLVYDHEVGLRIELHLRLFDKKQQGFLAQLDESRLFPMRDAAIMEVYGGEAWCFPPLQHALFMLCHMAKHMIVTGFGVRQLCDFVLFTDAEDANMDWKRFWQETEMLGLVPFTKALLEIGVQHLSLSRGAWAATMPGKPDPVAAELLLVDLMDAGVFGNRTQERTRSAAVVYRSFDEGADSRTARIRRALFIRVDELKPPYLYAKRHPWLLPVAWVHRWFRYAFGLIKGENARTEATQGMQIADERLQLLGRLGMRENEKECRKKDVI